MFRREGQVRTRRLRYSPSANIFIVERGPEINQDCLLDVGHWGCAEPGRYAAAVDRWTLAAVDKLPHTRNLWLF
jgi:hypothetical protein